MPNKAAYQKTFKSRPFTIENAPLPIPGPLQILIKNRAIGINPADAAAQNAGMVYDASQHPVILGFDVAGEVYAIGEQVTRFKQGDRVCAFPIDMGSAGKIESRNQHGAFQLYCVANEALAAVVPDDVSFGEAVVFPSCLSTAAYALFAEDAMALTNLPPISGRAKSNGKVLVVWGGSSVVGSTAIQLAVQAGYAVIATSSPLNFAHCMTLGASSVFDYKSPRVVEDVVTACRATGKDGAGAFVAYFDDASTLTCARIVSALGGSKVVGTVVPPHIPAPTGIEDPEVRIMANWGPALGSTAAGIHLWQHWLTPALADGRLQLSPRPEVHGHGLEALQGAVDTMWERVHMPFAPKAGEAKAKSISPRKLVVEIP